MPFFTGRAIHHSLEMYYSDGEPLLSSFGAFLAHERRLMGDLWPQEEMRVQEQIDLIVAMLQHYEMWISNMNVDQTRWHDDNLDFLALETHFEVPIRTPTGRASPKFYLAGRMDGVVRLRSDNSIWIWEVKTSRSIKELTRSLANDPQTGAYIYAAKELFDVEPQGVLYNIMRKKAPTQPETLQSGLLTRRSNIDTTAQAYLKAVREHHPDWKDDTIREFYGDILETLVEKGNQFFARIPIRRSQTEIDNLAEDLWAVALEMTNPSTVLYPNESWLNCNFCAFRAPCLTLNAGGDYEFLLANEYQRREKAVSWRMLEGDEEDD